ncbi:hypothetical protein D9M72_464870 [compost metagenome]
MIRALAQRQDWMGCGRLRKFKPDIEPLAHGDREVVSGNRLDRLPVDGDHLSGDRARVDGEGGGRRAIDDAQADASAAFDGDHFRIIERAVVGEIGVVLDVVEVHGGHARHRHSRHVAALHVGCHALHHPAVVHPVAACRPLKFGEQFLGRREGEIMQQDEHFLLVALPVVGGPHDQGRGKQVLLLERMRMHPVRAAGADRKPVAPGFIRFQKRCGIVRNPVHIPWRHKAVPVDERRFPALICKGDVERSLRVERQPDSAIRLEESEHIGGSAVHLDDAFCDRKRAGAPARRCRLTGLSPTFVWM